MIRGRFTTLVLVACALMFLFGAAAGPAVGATITGTVTAQTSGALVGDVYVYLMRSDGSGGWVWVDGDSDYSDSLGIYEFAGLPAGDYRVGFYDGQGRYISEWYKGASSFSGASTVTVSAAETTTGIDASMLDAAHVTGTVTAQAGGAPVYDVQVNAYRSDGSGTWKWVSESYSDPSGAYDIGRLPAGDYRILFYDHHGRYLSEYYDGAADQSLATTVTVGDAETKGDIDASLLGAPRTVQFVTDGTVGSTVSSGTQTVAYGEEASCTAVPPISHDFVEWTFQSGASAMTSNPMTFTVSADDTVTAHFAIKTFTLSFAVAPGGGGHIEGISPQTVNYDGSSTAVTAVADEGYRFVGWLDGPTDAVRTVNNVVLDATYTAVFAPEYTLIFATDGTPGASVSPTQSVLLAGEEASCTAAAPVGYDFVEWTFKSGAPTITSNPMTFTVSADDTITAHFAIKTFTLTYTAGVGGSVEGSLTQVVDFGDYGSEVTATPAPGYHFVGWSDLVLTPARTDGPVGGDVTVEAIFAADVYWTLNYTADMGGSIDGSATQSVLEGSDGTTVTAVPDAGYEFVKWSDDTTSAVRQDLAVTASLDVTATFAALPVNTFTLNYAADMGGSIDGSATQVVTEGSDGATVTAVPDEGYEFVMWSDDSTSAVRQDLAVMASLDVTATFAALPPTTFEIVPTASANGTITPSTTQTVDAGTDATFTFEAAAGYHVATVTVDASVVSTAGASVVTTGSYTFTDVQANHTIDVAFAKDDAVMMPVWRFRNLKLKATYLWTASDAERANIEATMAGDWLNEGVAFNINTSNPLNSDPLWRFLKTTSWTYFFTATEAEKDNTIANLSSMWKYEGPGFNVSLTNLSADPLAETAWRFRNASTNTFLYTGNVEKDLVLANNPEFTLEGPAFWVAP